MIPFGFLLFTFFRKNRYRSPIEIMREKPSNPGITVPPPGGINEYFVIYGLELAEASLQSEPL